MALRTTRFIGPLNAQMVAITVAQANQTANLGPIAWGVDPSPPGDSPHLTPGTSTGTLGVTIQLVEQEPFAHAPHGAVFQAVTTNAAVAAGTATQHDPQELRYTTVWQWSRDGDPTWGTSRWPKVLTGPDALMERGKQYGRVIGMPFHLPGTYRAIATMSDNLTGERATSPVFTFVVPPLAGFFTAAETFPVSSVGGETWAGAPAHNVGNRSTSIGEALSKMNAAGLQKAHMVLRAGGTYSFGNMGNNTSPGFNNNNQCLTTTAFGSGLAPNIEGGNVNAATNAGFRVYRFEGVRYHGTWDQGAGTGAMINSLFDQPNTHLVWANMSFDGIGAFDGSGVSHAYFTELDFTNWNGTPFIAPCHRVFVSKGCRMVQKADALLKSTNDPNSSENIGGFGYRIAGGELVCDVQQNQFFNRIGNRYSSAHITQSPLRLMTSPANPGGRVQCHANTCEGGGLALGGAMGGQVGEATVCCTRNIILLHHDMWAGAIQIAHSGVHIANNLVLQPPTRMSTYPVVPGPYERMVDLNAASGTPLGDPFGKDIIVENNTTVNLRDTGPGQVIAGAPAAQYNPARVFLRNHLIHQPYLPSGAVDAGPFTAASVNTPPTYQGFRTIDQLQVQPNTVSATHVVDIVGASPTGWSEGSIGSPVTLTAPGTIVAQVAQIHTSGTTRRLWLKVTSGAIANGATVTLSSGGTGTASGAMRPANMDLSYQTVTPVAPEAGAFSRVSFTGKLVTSNRRGVLMDV